MRVACVSQPEVRHRLPDGTVVRLRDLQPGEDAVVLEVFDGLGPRSRELRFLTPKPHLTAEDLRRLVAVDDRDHVAVVAMTAYGRAVGIARFVRTTDSPETAEAAVAVVDAWQGRGVGTTMVTHLMERARSLGLGHFRAVILRDNEPAVRLLHRAWAEVTREGFDRESVEFSISLAKPGRSRPPVRSPGTLKGPRP